MNRIRLAPDFNNESDKMKQKKQIVFFGQSDKCTQRHTKQFFRNGVLYHDIPRAPRVDHTFIPENQRNIIPPLFRLR